MRKLSIVSASALAGALLLSGCFGGGSPAKSLRAFVASFGAQSTLQVRLSADFTKAPATAKQLLNSSYLEMDFVNPSGGALTGASNVDSDLTLVLDGKTFVELRQVSGNLYAKLNLSVLSGLPGTHLPAAQIQAMQLFIGNRWFELTKSYLQQLEKMVPTSNQNAANERAVFAKVVAAFEQLLLTNHYTTTSTGYQETGTLKQLANAAYGIARQYNPGVTMPTTGPGTYTLRLSANGTTVTALSASVSAPYKGSGLATGTLSATIGHASQSITAPSGATVITKQLIDGLIAGGLTSSSSSSRTAVLRAGPSGTHASSTSRVVVLRSR